MELIVQFIQDRRADKILMWELMITLVW